MQEQQTQPLGDTTAVCLVYWSREDAFILLDIMRSQRCSWRILKAVWEYTDVILRLIRSCVCMCVSVLREEVYSFVVISFYNWKLCMRRCILVMISYSRVSWYLNNCFKGINPHKKKVLSIFTLHYAFFFFF